MKSASLHLLTLLSICLIFLTIESNFAKANSNDKNHLSDSIQVELQKPSIDTSTFNRLFELILRNRGKLNQQYKKLLEEYIESTTRNAYRAGQMEALDRLGLQERYDENYNKAIQYHNQALTIATELADSMQLSYIYNNLGQAYRKQDLNALAIRYFHKAIDIQEKIGHTKGIYFTQNTLGATYLAQEDYARALLYLNKAINAAKENNDKRSLSYNYGSIGEVYLAQNQIDSAMHFFELAKDLKIELNYDKGIPVSDHLIGQAYFAKGDMEKAKKSFKLALDNHKKYKNQRYQSLCLAYLGKIYLIQGKPDSAAQSLYLAHKLAKGVHSLESLILVEDALSEMHKAAQNYDDAFQALRNHYVYRDSILKVKSERNIQSLEIEYQTRQKEQEIAILSRDNMIKNQRIRIGIIILVLLTTIFALITMVYIQRRRNDKMLETELQHKLTRSQMNPHFVSNVMASIQKQLLGNNLEKSAEYLGKFAQLNRAVLEHSIVDRIPLDEEITMLSNYLEFEKLRLGNAFKFSIEMDDDLDAEMISIPPLFIQPFVENAVKHGVKDMNGDGQILIKLTDLDTLLRVEVIDNGMGITKSHNRNIKHKSRSMDIVKKRLQLLRRKSGKIPSLSIDSNSNSSGLHITLNLPITS